MLVFVREPLEGRREELGTERSSSIRSALTRVRFVGDEEGFSVGSLEVVAGLETGRGLGMLAGMDLRLLLLNVVEEIDSTAEAIAVDLDGISRSERLRR